MGRVGSKRAGKEGHERTGRASGRWARAVALIALLFLAAGVAAAAPAPLQLKYVGSWSNLSLFQNFEKPFWGETLPKALGGTVTFQISSVDQMGLKGPEVFRLLQMGLYQVAATTGDYVIGDVPALEGLDMPALAPDIGLARRIVDSYRPVVDEAFRRQYNATVLAIVPYPAQILFCRDRLESVADLKARKIRISGRSSADFVQAVGGTAINLAFSEVPQALERGVVDCAVTGSLSGYHAGWGEVSSYLYPLPVGGWDYVVTAMRLDDWNRLGAERQQALRQAIARDFEDAVWKAADRETQQGIACLTGTGPCEYGQPRKMHLVPLKDADRQAASQVLTQYVLPKWAARTSPEWVSRWNETIGKVTGLVAKP
ncbi:MAG: TRAP transporter substrate-binding protein [Limnochordaceae bacterium]|nr:TRAP transporter substrate-binding protein [Limnochordaceae bacterium]